MHIGKRPADGHALQLHSWLEVVDCAPYSAFGRSVFVRKLRVGQDSVMSLGQFYGAAFAGNDDGLQAAQPLSSSFFQDLAVEGR